MCTMYTPMEWFVVVLNPISRAYMLPMTKMIQKSCLWNVFVWVGPSASVIVRQSGKSAAYGKTDPFAGWKMGV